MISFKVYITVFFSIMLTSLLVFFSFGLLDDYVSVYITCFLPDYAYIPFGIFLVWVVR